MTAELMIAQKKLREDTERLEKFNALMVGREVKMVEPKKELAKYKQTKK